MVFFLEPVTEPEKKRYKKLQGHRFGVRCPTGIRLARFFQWKEKKNPKDGSRCTWEVMTESAVNISKL